MQCIKTLSSFFLFTFQLNAGEPKTAVQFTLIIKSKQAYSQKYI